MLTGKNVEKLCEKCGHDPEKIGVALLRLAGYKVEKYALSGAVYVYTKDGKKILYAYSGAYVD